MASQIYFTWGILQIDEIVNESIFITLDRRKNKMIINKTCPSVGEKCMLLLTYVDSVIPKINIQLQWWSKISNLGMILLFLIDIHFIAMTSVVFF